MNLKSCDNCGAVIDIDKATFQNKWNHDGAGYDDFYDHDHLDFNHHTRLVFTNPRSIDFVISNLEKAKKSMIND